MTNTDHEFYIAVGKWESGKVGKLDCNNLQQVL